jgi:hypothetical protein
MPHSPTNSRSSRDSPIRVSAYLRLRTCHSLSQVASGPMEPWDLWLSTFSANQLRPYGQIPETESFSRRNSLEVYNVVSLSRMFIDLPITNMDLKAHTEVVKMEFLPPLEIGGNLFPIVIPMWWWGAQKLNSEDIRAALRGEIEARLQGRPLEGTFVRDYVRLLPFTALPRTSLTGSNRLKSYVQSSIVVPAPSLLPSLPLQWMKTRTTLILRPSHSCTMTG